jgi:hypothetical protein
MSSGYVLFAPRESSNGGHFATPATRARLRPKVVLFAFIGMMMAYVLVSQ